MPFHQLMDVLEDPRFQAELARFVEACPIFLPNRPPPEPDDFGVTTYHESFGPGPIAAFMERHVLRHLAEPHIVTADDLAVSCRSAFRQPSGSFVDGFARFKDQLQDLLGSGWHSSEPIRVCLTPVESLGGVPTVQADGSVAYTPHIFLAQVEDITLIQCLAEWGRLDSKASLWLHGDHLGVFLCGTGPTVRNGFATVKPVHVCIAGVASPAAIEAMVPTIRAVLITALRSIQMLNVDHAIMRQRGLTIEDPEVQKVVESLTPSEREAWFFKVFVDGTVLRHARDRSLLPTLTAQQVCDPLNRSFLRKCLDAYFAAPTTKDSVNRRLRNCIRLVVLGEEQRDPGVAILLYVSALETLLSNESGSGNICKALAENIAVLLEPIGEHRIRAIQTVRDIYKARSGFTHGRAIAQAETTAATCRWIAAAAIRAVFDSSDTWRRSGEPESPQSLFEWLERCKFSRQQRMPGVEDYNVVDLWRTPS